MPRYPGRHAKLLKDGDIVNIDVTVIKDGFNGAISLENVYRRWLTIMYESVRAASRKKALHWRYAW
ncbi:hypothetical protein F4W66_24980 (plasmid) [Escherichia coli]|nr:hypothetical protein F4W66_24980 [Escherichia coli]